MRDYKCEDCDRDYGLLVLTPVGKGQVEVVCGRCFGDSILSGAARSNTIYLPSELMRDHEELLSDNRVVIYKILVW